MAEPETSEIEQCRWCDQTRVVYTYTDGTIGVAGPDTECPGGHMFESRGGT